MGLFDQSPYELLTGKKSPLEKKMSPIQTEYAKGTIGLVGLTFTPAGGTTASSYSAWKTAWTPLKTTPSTVASTVAKSAINPLGSVWGSLGTGGKVAVGAGAGLLTGWGITSFFSGKKSQEQTQAFAPQNPIQNTNTYTYSNQVTNTKAITGDWSTNLIYGGTGNTIKKGNLSGQAGPVNPSLTPQISVVPSNTAAQSGTQGQGTDWATLAAIAGVALVAYGYTSRKGK